MEVKNIYVLQEENEDLRSEVKHLKGLSEAGKREWLERENAELLEECGKLRIKYENLKKAYEKLDMVKWEEKLEAISKLRKDERLQQANHLKHLEYDFVARPQTSAGPLRETYERPSTAALMQVEGIDEEEEMELLDEEMKQMLKRNKETLA